MSRGIHALRRTVLVLIDRIPTRSDRFWVGDTPSDLGPPTRPPALVSAHAKQLDESPQLARKLIIPTASPELAELTDGFAYSQRSSKKTRERLCRFAGHFSAQLGLRLIRY